MHNPAHPGEVLREYLPEGVPIGEVAKRLGVTRQALSALLNGRAGVSASMALRLEGALGTSGASPADVRIEQGGLTRAEVDAIRSGS
jgi:addiction module HigA family antidote